MSSNTDHPTITLNSPDDLLREVPALLGFVPQQSLVAVLLDRSTLRCTLRWDLEHDLTEQAIRLIGVAHRAEADGAILAIYAEIPHEPFLALAMNRAADLLEEQGIAVHDLLWVSQGRWGSYLCAQPTCCPEDGRPLPVTTPHLEVVRVADGRPAVATSREAVHAALEVQPEPEDSSAYRWATEALLDRPKGEVADLAVRALSRLCTSEPPAPRDSTQVATSRALLVLAVQDIAVRDFVIGSIAADCEDVGAAAEAVTQAALCAPERLRAAMAATAMAVVALDGQSSVALWRMHELAEGQSLAALLAAAVEAGFPPHEVRDLFASTLADVRGQLDELDPAL